MFKSLIKAKLTKLNANTGDKLDGIQFQMRESEMEKYGQAVLKLRRYDNVRVSMSMEQGRLNDTDIEFFSIDFQSLATSVSICVTEEGLICTITLSLDDRGVFNDLVTQNLRGSLLTIEFEDGDNPYSE